MQHFLILGIYKVVLSSFFSLAATIRISDMLLTLFVGVCVGNIFCCAELCVRFGCVITRYSSLPFPHGAVGWYAACNYGFMSYSLTFRWILWLSK